ncbi:uncharacterized protein LOC116982787 [Amblyraja radiata]|uniref:uncharacterized protein LOC116982787 n=1 Tax=Amblyraja radiata TaxID=386614 RepID=UPI001401CFFC|nr:uncharacterized protein LOC116982787 [Amblyraja radiata]
MEEGQSGIRRVASPPGQGAECRAQPLALRSQDTSLCRWLMGLDQEEEQEETEIVESMMTIIPAPQDLPQPDPEESEVPAEASTAGRGRYRPQGKCCHRRSDKQQQVPRSMDRLELEGHQQVAEVPRSVSRVELEVSRDTAPSPCATFWMPRCVQMMLKSQRTRLPSSNAVTFDQFGNISSVQRLEAGRFRWHRPAPVFQLLEEATGCGRCRRRGDPPLRRLVFRSPPLPLRPGTGRGTGMPGRAAGKPPSGTVGQRPMLPHAQHTPDFPEFIPDGPKDRNHPHCGRHPQWEASSLDQLQPISSSLVLPPIALDQLAVDLSL